MQTLYKLTDKNMQTHGNCQWVLNEEKTASGQGNLCTSGWLHAYTHPLLAALLNPIHANFPAPRLFKARGVVGKTDGQLKVGCTRLTLTEELPLPEITTNQRTRFAILCAQRVVGITCPEWSKWAAGWLSGENRSRAAAGAAAGAAAAAAAVFGREGGGVPGSSRSRGGSRTGSSSSSRRRRSRRSREPGDGRVPSSGSCTTPPWRQPGTGSCSTG